MILISTKIIELVMTYDIHFRWLSVYTQYDLIGDTDSKSTHRRADINFKRQKKNLGNSFRLLFMK